MSDTLILETERGTSRLYKDCFIHEGETYLIADMKKAELNSGFLELTTMAITFKNGEVKRFRVGSVSNSASLHTVLSGFLVDNAGDDLKKSTQQWITAVNMLIAFSR